MSITAASLLGAEGRIAQRLDGFEIRPQQLEMAEAVARAQAEKGHLFVEAGTGVGKSFAYLIPSIARVLAGGETNPSTADDPDAPHPAGETRRRERVVICTSTISLQEQLLEKDIPLLNAIVPDEFSAVLVKGRGNYLSLRRLKLASERQDKLLGDEEERHSLEMIEDWAYRTRDGSLATLPQLPRPAVWDHAQSDASNCMGRRCPTYDKCFFQAARRRMEHGDLLVTNHALFFSDLALRRAGAGILPEYQHVVFDEAHMIEDVAAEHFGARVGESGVRHLLRLLYHPRTARGYLETAATRDGETIAIDRAIGHVLECHQLVETLFDALWRWSEQHGGSSGRVTTPRIVENQLSPALRELSASLVLLKERVEREADEFEIASYAARATMMADQLDALLGQTFEGCVYWLEQGKASRQRRGRPNMTLACAAVDIGPILRETLFQRDVSVVCTSATLATGKDDFSHVTTRLGCDDARTLQLGSPFDHGRQMRAIVETSVPEPSDPNFHDELARHVVQHVRATDGGAFVLFTSFRMLDAVAERAATELAIDGHPLHIHGRSGPRSLLLRRFRDDDRSVLFGTMSFWQGVDVRGRALRNVIITRLPFDVPDRPLVQARHERIEARGGRPFMEDQIPRAVIRFKQGIGRLIRSHDDAGRIVVLDPRVVTKFYGRFFRDALPEGVEFERGDEW